MDSFWTRRISPGPYGVIVALFMYPVGRAKAKLEQDTQNGINEISLDMARVERKDVDHLLPASLRQTRPQAGGSV